jgi:transposase
MKSGINVDLRTPYCGMTFKRSPEEQVAIRQKIVRYAQQYGNKPAARHYGCDVRTVRTWERRFIAQGSGGLINKSRAPHRSPHKLSREIEEQIVQKRKKATCYGPKRLKFFNPSLQASEGAIYRVLRKEAFFEGERKNTG